MNVNESVVGTHTIDATNTTNTSNNTAQAAPTAAPTVCACEVSEGCASTLR